MNEFTGFYAAWFSNTGVSWFKKPQKLWKYENLKEGWQKSGNHDAPLREGFHTYGPSYAGNTVFVSRDPDKVRLIIEAVNAQFKAFCRKHGVVPKEEE